MSFFKNLKSFFKLRLLKLKNLNYPFWRIDKEKSIELIKKGGWHFTYLMKPKEISKNGEIKKSNLSFFRDGFLVAGTSPVSYTHLTLPTKRIV